MSYPITCAARRMAEKVFAPPEAAEILAVLAASDLPLLTTMNASVERVHLAILHLAGGSMERFRSVLQEARQDWRDALVTAGLGNEDWSQILHHRDGIIPSLTP